jgi:hypothetical protein
MPRSPARAAFVVRQIGLAALRVADVAHHDLAHVGIADDGAEDVTGEHRLASCRRSIISSIGVC